MNHQTGKLILISGPSGTGKSTVIARLMRLRDDVCFSVSATTRDPRPGEVDGKDYFFVTRTAFDAMKRGDSHAKKIVDDYIFYLAEGVTNMINIFQPEVLVIGGGICKEGDYLTKPLEEYIKRESYCINPERSTVLGICKLGNDAGIVGAANLYRLKD